MDAHALLKSQGWRGHGHTLHPSDDSAGLARPLLISRKDNTFGIGKKEHCTSDQWWLNAFDQQLQGLDTTGKTGTAVVQTVQRGALNAIQARGAAARYTGAYGLYASFVRGGLLEGTISSPSSSGDSTPRDTSATAESTPGSGIDMVGRSETKSERKARRAQRRRERAEKKARKSTGGVLDVEEILAARRKKKMDKKALETKEERRTRREAKRKRKRERRKGPEG
ncbi:hypothetical protein MAPG_06832 [Magnaporthiopsis poae ATCC 64411]|uniref:G-patch domain-containing protein n=1 Tax=Magnaporthiopsis poae (strain ATCC 64411 / 73-15) TaxID=644358 RepID=A0A0C4E340_MAGP6|nr:hypothetical protein MAPG_06832 [Magnaporthiopsis poae ATCC 64411]